MHCRQIHRFPQIISTRSKHLEEGYAVTDGRTFFHNKEQIQGTTLSLWTLRLPTDAVFCTNTLSSKNRFVGRRSPRDLVHETNIKNSLLGNYSKLKTGKPDNLTTNKRNRKQFDNKMNK